MDGLTNDERLLAWQAIWNPSFTGLAIVNPDFTFRSVNPQFCKLLGVSPAELINQKFQDVTHPADRIKEESNAKMLIAGLIDFYILPKRYQFSDGREVEVILLVTRAPAANQGAFQFFVSRIMLDESSELHTTPEKQKSEQCSPTPTAMVVDFMMTYGKWIAAIGTIVGSILITLFGG